jgi:site-specific DNA-methyltransferase (adenine-specific)
VATAVKIFELNSNKTKNIMTQTIVEPKIELYNMDCMEYMATCKDNEFDLAIVDPPYGIERFKKVTDTPSEKDVHAKRFQGMELVNDIKPTQKYWDELFRVSKHQIVFGANNFTMPESEYFLIWDKKQAMPNFARCEYAWVSMSLKKPAKICEYSIHKHNQVDKIHQTQKPIYLYEWILMNYAKEDFEILDTHLGSGSSAIAAYNYKFDFVGLEIDKEYFDAAVKRFNNHKSQLTLF